MAPSLPSRAHGAQMAVLGLGLLSALALFGASLADFGDPRATSRAQAQRMVRAQIAEVRVAWDEARTDAALPPGAMGLVRLGRDTRAAAPPAGLTESAGSAAPGQLTRAYFELGHAALERGDAAVALESFTGGLADTSARTAGYRAALFGALRAAGALGETERVHQFRAALYDLPDQPLEGTSHHLLAALIPPIDAVGAHARLLSDATLLPIPVDRVTLGGEGFILEPDPWWSALRTQLTAVAPPADLDWNAAFQTADRLQRAIRRALIRANFAPDARWTIAKVQDGWLAARQRSSDVEVAIVRPEAFGIELLGDTDQGPLMIQIGLGGTSPDTSTPLPGSPFSVAVTHTDPEGAASIELRRIRILRTALVGLGILVLLATALSARAMARARQLSDLRSTFVASVSHDLRTPTQAILLLAETLEQDLVEAPEGRARYHTQIRKEAQRLRRLVEDLLDGARIDRGDGARIERRHVQAVKFFQELRAAMEERAGSAGAQLQMEVAAMPESLHVDPDGLYRAVWNLFENALRYGRNGDAAAEVSVTAAAQGSHLKIVVADLGPGIPPQHAKSIFRPFQRLADRRPKSEIQSDTGTGLGLAIVRAICRAHGGSVELHPQAVGARFVLTLPIEAPEGDAL